MTGAKGTVATEGTVATAIVDEGAVQRPPTEEGHWEACVGCRNKPLRQSRLIMNEVSNADEDDWGTWTISGPASRSRRQPAATYRPGS